MIHDENTDALHFGIQRSVRYHDRRVAHFDILHKITNVLTILLSGVVILELTGVESPLWVKISAAIAAIFGAFDLVVGFSHRANQHRDLKRRFCVLEIRMIQSKSREEVEAVLCERLQIEAEEPPIFRALDAKCHNEMLISKGYTQTDPDDKIQFRYLPRHKRWTANWLRWPDLTSTVP
jgi:hypothetical protein